MGLLLRRPMIRTLSDDELASWHGVPTPIVSDELNREAAMGASIAPISTVRHFVGEAVTVNTMVGDNLALHVVANGAPRGSVIVVNAQSYLRIGPWGEILHTAAVFHGVAAVVIDGAIRDRGALERSPIPVFACGSAPNGPHKGWGGTINGAIQCGGVSVSPGDLVIGDDDGVVVIPSQELSGLRERCRLRLEKEATIIKKVSKGESTIDLLGLNVSVINGYGVAADRARGAS